MKLTRRQLNIIVEDYLREELLNEQMGVVGSDFEIEVPRCDFKFRPEFLQFFTYMKTGQIPRNSILTDDPSKPDFISPVFKKALTDQLLPFMNLVALPTFGLGAKCRALKRMQDLFNGLWDDYKGGVSSALDTKPSPEEMTQSATAAAESLAKAYDQYFARAFPVIVNSRNLKLTEERKASFLDDPSIFPTGLTLSELMFASFLFGNLEPEKVSKNKTSLKKLVIKLKEKKANSSRDLYRIFRNSDEIPGYDDATVKFLLDNTTSAFGSDRVSAAETTRAIILELVKKLQAANIF